MQETYTHTPLIIFSTPQFDLAGRGVPLQVPHPELVPGWARRDKIMRMANVARGWPAKLTPWHRKRLGRGCFRVDNLAELSGMTNRWTIEDRRKLLRLNKLTRLAWLLQADVHARARHRRNWWPSWPNLSCARRLLSDDRGDRGKQSLRWDDHVAGHCVIRPATARALLASVQIWENSK